MEFNPHIADLMLAIRANRPTVITHSSSKTKLGQKLASFSWKTTTGQWDSFQLKGENFHCQAIEENTIVAEIDTPESWCDLVDKLLNAIVHNCHVQALNLNGTAVLSWDRASHGNTPTIVLHPDDSIENYYDWPYFLPEHLEPKHTNPVPDSIFYDHIKQTQPPHVHNRPFTWDTAYQSRDELLPTCQVQPCGNLSDYNALDHRHFDHGPLCNYHLYGPRGYATTRQPYQEFTDWLKATNRELSSLIALELHHEQLRAQNWSNHR